MSLFGVVAGGAGENDYEDGAENGDALDEIERLGLQLHSLVDAQAQRGDGGGAEQQEHLVLHGDDHELEEGFGGRRREVVVAKVQLPGGPETVVDSMVGVGVELRDRAVEAAVFSQEPGVERVELVGRDVERVQGCHVGFGGGRRFWGQCRRAAIIAG